MLAPCESHVTLQLSQSLVSSRIFVFKFFRAPHRGVVASSPSCESVFHRSEPAAADSYIATCCHADPGDLWQRLQVPLRVRERIHLQQLKSLSTWQQSSLVLLPESSACALRAQQKSKRVLAEGQASASRPHVAPARHGSAAHCALGRSLNRCSGSALCLFKTCSPSFEFCHNLTVELRSTARLLTQLFAFELQLGLRRKSHGFRRNLRFNRCNCRFFRSGNSSNHLRSRRVS